MARYGLAPMIAATAFLAMPVLAATPTNGAANSPADANPAATAPAPIAQPGAAMTTTPGTTAHDQNAANTGMNAKGDHAATASSSDAATTGTTTGSTTAAANDHGTSSSPAASSTASNNAGTSTTSKFMTSDNQVRIGKVVGATVYNDKNQSVGSIDDVLVSENQDKAQTAIISVGGFLGMGSKLISVPFNKLKIENNKVIMPGATKDALKSMPEYKYNNA